MGRAGRALKQVLADYGISQYKLAMTIGVDRSNVSRWVKEQRDPTGDVIFQIKEGLKQLNPEAAEKFLDLYLSEGG